jgi:chromosome segregation protein
VIDRITAAAGYERALAAALGDDVSAGLDTAAQRHWAGVDGAADAPVADSLAPHVTAPPQLARRLAHVIVRDADDGRALLPGQRLVTRAGAMRRWDGFVAGAGGAAVAARLERANRLAALRGARPAAAAALDHAEAQARDADAAIAATRVDAATARRSLARAEDAARAARQREDRAAAALERLEAQRADLATRTARAAAELDEADAERARAAEALAALPDGTAVAAEVSRLQQTAQATRTAVAEARSTRTQLDQATTQMRERRAAAQAEARSWRARAGDAARRIADMARREAALEEEATALADRPAALDAALAEAIAAHDEARATADRLAADEHAADAALRHAEEAARRTGAALAAAREARAAAAARAEAQEQRRIELGRAAGERFACPAPVLPTKAGFDSATVTAPADESAAHDRLVLERERIGAVNLIAERELAELEAATASNAAERAELGEAVARLRGSIGTLNREGRQRLRAAFEAVDAHFRRLFATLFDGGQAHLALVDSDDPLEAGLEIMAQPPGKRLQSLTLLSGGEQALTAVALIFGLFLTNPAPICVLDEVDAPLDDANIERFCDLLDRMAAETRTRYLIVTHNAVTMSRMHRLFGVTMVERGVSRLVSVDLRAAETLLAAE